MGVTVTVGNGKSGHMHNAANHRTKRQVPQHKRDLKGQVSVLLATLERKEQTAPKQGTTSQTFPGDLKGGGPKKKQPLKECKHKQVASNSRELSAAELRQVLEKWAPKWEGRCQE